MTILKSKKMRNCLLIGMLLCLFTGTFYSYAAVAANSSAGASGVTTSDVFFVYPNSLRQQEPNLRSLRAAAENAVLTMESDGEFWSLFQGAVSNPGKDAMTALTDWINGTDTRGAECALSATEDLLSQIAESSELYEFGQYCTGPYQEFYKRAKSANGVNGAVEDLAEFYLDTQHERVEDILTAILSDESGAVRELVLQDMDEHQTELLDAIDKGTEGVSEAMKLLKYANRFTELVETIALLDCVEDEMIDYLYDTVTTEDLKEAIQTYRGYKTNNHVTYVMDKWVKEDALDGLVDLFKEAVQGILMESGVHPSAIAFYKVAKLVMSLYGKLIGKISGYGDADIYITTYKSWNYVQEMERVLSDKRANIIYNPCTMDSICEYERAYELYVAAVIAFAENAKKANRNAAEGIDQYLGIVKGMRDSYEENRLGPFYAHIQRCKDYLALEENREACRRQTPDNSVLEYTISSEDDITIRTSSNNLEAGSIYTASDGNLFYGIRLDGGRLEVACNATVPGNVTASYTEHTLKVAEGASLHIGGNLVTESNWAIDVDDADRKLEVNGSLTVDGNLELSNETLTVAGDAAKLTAKGDANLAATFDIQSGELEFNGGLDAYIEEIGQATVYLNTPANKNAYTGYMKLSAAENADETGTNGTNAAANVVLRGGSKEEGDETQEISGNVPSHELEVYRTCTQTGKSSFRSLRVVDGGNMTIAGEAGISENVTSSYNGHTLKVAEGASLHIDGNLVTESNWAIDVDYADRKLEVNGSLTVEGNLELYNETLTVAGDAAKLKVNGDAISGTAENILSGELIFNGGLSAGLRNIGQATVYLNTPADRSVFAYRFNLREVENKEVADEVNTQANLVLRGAATEEDPDAVEINGNAPSHRLTLNGGCTLKGKSLFGELRIDNDHLTIAGETEIGGNLTTGEERYHLAIADGGSLHIDGDFISGNGNSTYLYEDYRIVEIYGKLTVDGSMVLFGNLTIDGDAARLEANGYALLGKGNVGNIQSGELILNGGVEGPESIGQATVHLNTPAGEEASIGSIRLIPIENAGETGEASAAANFVFHVIEGELGPEADVISGSAPSHRLEIGRECIQEDKTTLGELKVSGTLTITGETEIIGDLAYYEWGYKLNIAEGASLHVGGHSQLEFFNQFESVRDRRVEVNGSLIMDGWLDVDELTVAGDNARLVINEDMNIKEGSDIQSGVLTFNGGLGSEIEDIGSAEVILTGQNDGSVHLMGIYFERNEASPNMRIVKEDGTVFISPYAEEAPVSAANLTLRNHSFELADGTYDIGAVTLESGSLDLNHSLVFTGNLALNGESAEQSADNSSVVVRGDFSSRLSEGDFSGGVLKAAGDFSADGSDAYRETGSHRTVLDGTKAQKIGMYSEGNHLNILELENDSEEGVRLDSDIYVDRLFDHHRRHFTLAVSEEDRFADYDGDGVKDHRDPYPTDPGKSALAFAVQAIADQTYTGGELTPELTVIDEENNTLRAGTDYEVSFADNTRPGTATAVVTGKGFYTGSEEVRFNIVCHHSWTKWQFVEVPSAEESGKKERTCEICGEKEEESIPELEAVLTLPANLTKIESEAFSGLTSVDAVRVPETVVEIADDAFEGSDIIIIAPEGSYILQWAEENDKLCIVE